MTKLIIGTRGSKLALIQTEMVQTALLKHYPQLEIEVKIITTSGDVFKDAVLAEIGGKELFTREIDHELLAGNIDLAVHSLKDVPGIISAEQKIIATLPRGDARDALIGAKSLNDLPSGAVVGSASPRRKAQILNFRPDLQVVNFRGNVPSRVRKVIEKEVTCTLLAMAGLDRLQLEVERHPLSIEEMLPCAGQGIIAVAARSNNVAIAKLAADINHLPTFAAATAERAVLATYNGNCQTPIAAHALIKNHGIFLSALIATTDGKQIFRAKASGAIDQAEKIGNLIGDRLLKNSKGFS